MSLLNRCSSSSCMAEGSGGWRRERLSRGPAPRPPKGPRRPGRRAAALLALRRVLGIELAQLDGRVREPGRQVVEPQVPGAVLVLEGDPDLGPPGLLVVADVVRDTAPTICIIFLSFMILVLCVKSRSLERARFARGGSTGAPREARPAFTEGRPRAARGNRESRRAGPPKGGRRPSRRRDQGGPARNESRSGERSTREEAGRGRRNAMGAWCAVGARAMHEGPGATRPGAWPGERRLSLRRWDRGQTRAPPAPAVRVSCRDSGGERRLRQLGAGGVLDREQENAADLVERLALGLHGDDLSAAGRGAARTRRLCSGVARGAPAEVLARGRRGGRRDRCARCALRARARFHRAARRREGPRGVENAAAHGSGAWRVAPYGRTPDFGMCSMASSSRSTSRTTGRRASSESEARTLRTKVLSGDPAAPGDPWARASCASWTTA